MTLRIKPLRLLAVGLLALLLSAPILAGNADKPNIVLVLMDNFGYGELGVYGGGILRGAATPRIDALAASSSLTRGQIIEDALSHGRSLAWHEKWVAGVREGLADANDGLFATEEEIAAVLSKYGPV